MVPLRKKMKRLRQEILAQFSPELLEQIAKQTHFIQRKQKVTAMDTLFLFVFMGKHLSNATLDKEIPEMKKIDTWIDGELTVFALTIDDKPSIAIFTYSNASYKLIEVKEGKQGEIVIAKYENYLFIYSDKYYTEDTATILTISGDTYSNNVLEQKGRLTINKNPLSLTAE